MLNTLNEYFLSLPDDMFLDINPRDNNSLETGVNFIKEFNNSLLYFTTGSNEIEAQIKNYFSINIEEDIQKENIDDGRSIRSIKELDNSKSYSLDEDFTYKRPFGFVLQGSAYKGLKTWKGLYVSVLKELQAIDISRFSGLTEEEDFISSRGNHLFSSKPEGLRVSEKLATDFYTAVAAWAPR